MKRATPLHLSEDERRKWEVCVRSGKANARTLTRARVLLKCDEGWSNGDIAEAFEVSDQTIRNVRQRYGAGGVEAVLTDKRQARRRQALSHGQAAHLLAITCSEVPDGHDHWTLRMLVGRPVELPYVPRLSPETLPHLPK